MERAWAEVGGVSPGLLVPAFTFNPGVAGYAELWDMSDLSAITHTSGAVSSLASRGTGHNALVQATGGIQPATGTRSKNGRNVFDFDGTDDYLETAGNIGVPQPYTLFVVAANDDGADSTLQVMAATNAVSATNLQKGSTNFWSMNDGTNRNSAVAPNTAWHYFTKVGNGTSSLLRLDGAQIIAPGSTIGTNGWNTNHIRVGRTSSSGTGYWDGGIGLVLLYPSQLSGGDISTVEAAIAAYWAI